MRYSQSARAPILGKSGPSIALGEGLSASPARGASQGGWRGFTPVGRVVMRCGALMHCDPRVLTEVPACRAAVRLAG